MATKTDDELISLIRQWMVRQNLSRSLVDSSYIRTEAPGLPDSRILPGVVTPATVKL